jgi:hypothetical protein
MKQHILILLILLMAGTARTQSHVSDLVVTPAFGGGTIKWYYASTGGTALYPITTIHTDIAKHNETMAIKIRHKFRIFPDSGQGLNL